MGFFEGFKKMIQGKPVFEVTEDYKQTEKEWSDHQDTELTYRIEPKTIPEIVINEFHCHVNGNNMECEFVLQNKSAEIIEIRKIILFGIHTDINDHLPANYERSFIVYRGPKLMDTYKHECRIEYKNYVGDYFASIHNIDFQKESDGTYIIARVKFIPPVRDI